jgi:hypothetical protein
MAQRCRRFKEDYVADEMLARMRLHQRTVETERLREAVARWRRLAVGTWAALAALALAALAARGWA